MACNLYFDKDVFAGFSELERLPAGFRTSVGSVVGTASIYGQYIKPVRGTKLVYRGKAPRTST
jgi:hypothetical protein